MNPPVSKSDEAVPERGDAKTPGSLSESQLGALPISLPGFPLLKEKWLNCFLALSTHATISEAAKNQGLTPRSLLRNLHELEKKLGTPLIARDSRDRLVILTEGVALLKMLKPLYQHLEVLKRDFSSSQTALRNELSISSCGPWPRTVLPKLLDGLYADYGNLLPIFHHLSWDHEVEQMVLNGEANLGLTCRQPPHRQLAWAAGKPSPYAIVSLPQAQSHWQSLAYVAGIPPQTSHLHGPWDEQRFPRQIVTRTEHMSLVLDLISGGQCAAWLPLCLVGEFIDERYLAIVATPPEPQSLFPHLIWRPDREQTPLVRQALQHLQKSVQAELRP